MVPLLVLLPYLVSIAFGSVLPRQSDVHLAISPNCGMAQDFSIGVSSLSDYDTVVAFGDSYTDAGNESGGPVPPAVVVPPNPKAGGRSSNGPVWIEDLATAANATLNDYATAGSLIDATQYPGASLTDARDFFGQIDLLISQPTSRPEPDSTLYTVFFGMGDFIQSDGFTTLDPNEAASGLLYGMLELASSPIFAKNFLVVDNYGRGTTTPNGQAYKTALYTGINTFITKYNVNVAFADFSHIWNSVLGPSPGYEAFGYTSTGACVSNVTTVGECADPDHTFYWMPGNPSKVTHQIMADYVSEVIEQCQY